MEEEDLRDIKFDFLYESALFNTSLELCKQCKDDAWVEKTLNRAYPSDAVSSWGDVNVLLHIALCNPAFSKDAAHRLKIYVHHHNTE